MLDRRRRTIINSTNAIRVRVSINQMVWRVAEEYSSGVMNSRISPAEAFELMVEELGEWLLKPTEPPAFMSSLFQKALTTARGKAIASVVDPIDDSQLHRSIRCKSGFVGVYANGKGYRAEISDEQGSKTLGTFQSAREAAWARRTYYIDNKKSYGALEQAIQEVLLEGYSTDMGPLSTATPEYIKHFTIYTRALEHKPIPGLSAQDRALEQTDPMTLPNYWELIQGPTFQSPAPVELAAAPQLVEPPQPTKAQPKVQRMAQQLEASLISQTPISQTPINRGLKIKGPIYDEATDTWIEED